MIGPNDRLLIFFNIFPKFKQQIRRITSMPIILMSVLMPFSLPHFLLKKFGTWASPDLLPVIFNPRASSNPAQIPQLATDSFSSSHEETPEEAEDTAAFPHTATDGIHMAPPSRRHLKGALVAISSPFCSFNDKGGEIGVSLQAGKIYGLFLLSYNSRSAAEFCNEL